ncbi:MAG: lasso peptide biosynthesis B2 protein [Clostridiaceae bacterium]|nr:lasso peptide biosynthesis B2 protein [Clostridiaceae bacterium]
MPSLSQLNKKLKNFLKRSNGDKLLFFQAFIICGIARSIILLIQFNKIRTYIGTYKKESSFQIENSKYELVKKIAWAVNSASLLTPWKSKCLVKALTAQKMLKNHKIYSTLYLGVAKGGERGIQAHAWLRCGQLIVTGGNLKDNFKEVARFSNEK